MKILKSFFTILFFMILFVLMFFCADFYVFQKEVKIYWAKSTFQQVFKLYLNFVTRDISESATKAMIIKNNKNFYNEIQNINSKNSILLFGCSFTYGLEIPKDKTLHKVLAKHTNKAIYDRSMLGWGINQMLFQLKDDEFFEIVPKPDTIIYTFINDHARRLYMPTFDTINDFHGAFYNYNVKTDTLTQRKDPTFYKRFVILAKVVNKFRWILNNKEIRTKAILKHFKESKDIVNKHWGNDVKFIILFYYYDYYSKQIIKELQDYGFIVLYRNDLFPFEMYDTNYCLSNSDSHPNDKAWELIVPKLLPYL